MRTSDAISKTVAKEAILFSLFLFGLIYLLLGALYLFLFFREMNHGPEPAEATAASVNPKEVFA
jgi:cytochrome bd ubiquinol oxidase subunit I